MTKKEIIEYLYENNVRGDLTIEQMAEDIADTPQTETKTETQNSNVILVSDGVSEMIRCAMCNNPNQSYKGCDGACSYDEKLYKRIMDAIDESRVDTPQTDYPSCETCKNKGVEGCEQPCLGCGCCGLYEAMTGNDKLKEKVVEFIKSCARCKHRPIGAMMCEESCHYEPKTEPQYDIDKGTIRCDNCSENGSYKCFKCDGEMYFKRLEVEDETQTERSE